MKNWPAHLYRGLELAAGLAAATAVALAGHAALTAAAGLPVPVWAWALLTAPAAAAITATWRDLPGWITTWLNWRAEQIARLQQRWGLNPTAKRPRKAER